MAQTSSTRTRYPVVAIADGGGLLRYYADFAVEILPEIGDQRVAEKVMLAVLQVCYLCDEARKDKRYKTNFRNDHWWTYQTTEDWRLKWFLLWGHGTVGRIFKLAVDKGFLIKGKYNKFKQDKTIWYRPNFEKLAQYESLIVKNYVSPEPPEDDQEDESGNEEAPELESENSELDGRQIPPQDLQIPQWDMQIPPQDIQIPPQDEKIPQRDNVTIDSMHRISQSIKSGNGNSESGNSTFHIPEFDEPGFDELTYEPVDTDGAPIPLRFDPKNKHFKAITALVYGSPMRKLDGEGRRQEWLEALQRMNEDVDYRRWCYFVAKVESTGKHLNHWFKTVANEDSFMKFLQGTYTPQNELEEILARAKADEAEGDEVQVGTRLFEEAKAVEV